MMPSAPTSRWNLTGLRRATDGYCSNIVALATAALLSAPLCPFCMSADTDWREASGDGTIYSWSVERRASPPFAIAFVKLAEGPTLMTAIVDADLDNISVDQKVTLKFEERNDTPVPVFTPAS